VDSGRSAAFVRPDGSAARSPSSGGSLGDALRNLQRYVQGQSFDNPTGGQGAFGPAIQFDTKGVEFGPWIRRFIAQIKRNWLIPYAAMSLSGHVVITFNVHKDGRLTDLTIVGPSAVDGFNNAAFNALVSSNPTQPLPPEYPADKAFFTVTFFYNETPPSQE
jgi:TonB family protein